MILKKDLQDWFTEHRAISPRKFAIECGYPDGGRFRSWIKVPAKEGEVVSSTILNRIKKTLEKYGYFEKRTTFES